MYTAQLDRVEGKDNMQFTSVIRCQKSEDGGKTWSEYETMFPEEGSFCRQPIQVLSNGRWIFGNWICTDSKLGLTGDPTAFRISDDEGKTWKRVDMPRSNGAVHANVVELEPGHLAAFMRSRAADNIYRSESLDNGDTWSEPVPTVLPNNNSSISAIRLQSGRIAIAYNPTCTPCPTPGIAAWPGLRCPVAVALSEDGGLTFPIIRYMERGEGFMGEENRTNNKQYEYPYLMQDRSGRLHLAFAYKNRIGVKYMSFTEEDVMGKKREKVGLYNPTAAQSR
jgi:predicted neuraminidase